MTAGALLWLLLQAPEIADARTLTGGAAREGCWLPLEATVAAEAPFDGSIAAVCGPVVIRRPLRLAPGERRRIALPALPVTRTTDIELQIRDTTGTPVRRHPLAEPLTFLADDELLIATRPLTSSEGARTFELTETWNDLDPALFDAVDAILAKDPGPWPAHIPRHRPAATRPRFKALEPDLDRLSRTTGWIESRRHSALLFITLYAFAVFVTLLTAARRKMGIAATTAALAGLSGATAALFLTLFPTGRTSVHAWGVVADGIEHRLHLVQGTGPVHFTSLAKPIASTGDMLGSVEIVIDQGCTITGARALLTIHTHPPALASGPADRDHEIVRFLTNRFSPAEVLKVREADPPLDGVSGPGIVELRMEPRLIVTRRTP